MRLQEYLDANDVRPSDFALLIGVSRQAVDRYRRRQRIPDQEVMGRIFKVTRGEVRPDDFYDLPKLRKPRNNRES